MPIYFFHDVATLAIFHGARLQSSSRGERTLVIRDVWALKAAGNALSGG